MSGREVPVSRLIGRVVRDGRGERVGRIEDLRAEIRLQARGNDYYVVELVIGAFGWLDSLAGGRFGQQIIERLGIAGYRRYRVPWHTVNLSDPDHPRLTCRREELAADPDVS